MLNFLAATATSANAKGNIFYTAGDDGWGTTIYTPTFLGKVVLALLVIILLLGAVAFTKVLLRKLGKKDGKEAKKDKKKEKKITVIQLAVCAMLIALGTVLSELKLDFFGQGGSITLFSMLVICLPGYFFGMGAGVLTGVAYGILQLIIDPYVIHPAQLIVDYILAFGALGLSGLFHKAKNGLIPGYIAAILGRFVFAVISGWIFFAEYAWKGWGALSYSLVYNGIYIFTEGAITIAVLCIPQVRAVFKRLKGSVFGYNNEL